MLKNALFLFASLTFATAHVAPVYAHGPESRLGVEFEDDAPQAAGDLNLSFDVLDLKKRTVLSDKGFLVSHEKILHLFIFDEALQEFRHEHPEYSEGKWRVKVTLPRNGRYLVWAQGTLASDRTEATGSGDLSVFDGEPANPSPARLVDTREGTSGLTAIALSKTRIVANRAANLTLSFRRTDGSKPQLTPYLGEVAHIVATPDDGDSLVHVHPMVHGDPLNVMVHATFPAKGNYRLWVQFIDGGELKVVPLAVTVF